MLLCKGGERRTEHRELQCRHFLAEQFRQYVDISLVTRGSIAIPQPQPIKLRQHLVLEKEHNIK